MLSSKKIYDIKKHFSEEANHFKVLQNVLGQILYVEFTKDERQFAFMKRKEVEDFDLACLKIGKIENLEVN